MPRKKKLDNVVAIDAATGKKKPDMEFIGSAEEGVLRSIASRETLRNKVDSEVEAFLKAGGQINKIEPNVMADPPRKPTSNYGSRPIWTNQTDACIGFFSPYENQIVNMCPIQRGCLSLTLCNGWHKHKVVDRFSI